MAVAAGSVSKGSTDQILYITKMTNTSSQTPTTIAATINGTFVAGDLSSVKFYRSNNPVIDGTSIALLTSSASGNGSGYTYTLNNTNPFTGVRYLIVAADVAAGAVVGHTLISTKFSLVGTAGVIEDDQNANGSTKTITT